MEFGPALAALSLRIGEVTVETSKDVVLALLEKLEFVRRAVKESQEKLEAALVAYIQHHGPLHVSDTVDIALTHAKSVKCKNVRACAEALLNELGGDWEAFAGCLSSGAFKYGALKKAAPGTYEQHFDETWSDDVKVTRLDQKYLK